MYNFTTNGNDGGIEHQAALIIQHQWHVYQRRKDGARAQRLSADVCSGVTNLAVMGGGDATSNIPTGRKYAQVNSDSRAATGEEVRQAMLAEYGSLLVERDEMVKKNWALQHILAQHLRDQRVRKSDDATLVLTTPEKEQQYWEMIGLLMRQRLSVARKHAAMQAEMAEQQQRYQGVIDAAATAEYNFRQFIREIAANALFMHGSQRISADEIACFMENEERQRDRIRTARIRYLKLRNEVTKLQKYVSEKDCDSDGIYLIDFEQMKIENANLTEKIEERNEDIARLRRKITTTVHVLTHVKEKLEFVKDENAQLSNDAASTEEELSKVRDQLTQVRRRRDGFSRANQRMRERMPLVGSEDLLLDYEKRKGAIDNARRQVVALTTRHKKLMSYIQTQLPVIESLKRTISHYPNAAMSV